MSELLLGMANAQKRDDLRVIRRVLLAITVVVALAGVVAAIATATLWPLVALLSLVLPFWPLETPMTRRRRTPARAGR
ncbi:hypothetical protein EV141_0721 [Microcella putealis]|uniref:Uncharacterized protein n=2 Tax=Microcella putealis TaxID=337005 RepID=A0A4Q7LXG2_9MICO|nr:hypothetical protein EV141_0721 [Microcella putealis]TQM26607.1 hypothetical protein BJ957_0017 [Microcella putealis]